MITTTNKYEQLSKERKRKQVEGTIPEWYTTPSWQMFSSSYSHESEMDVLDRHMTIAKTWSQYMPNPDYWCRRFFDLLWSGKYSPATPALATGNNNQPQTQAVEKENIQKIEEPKETTTTIVQTKEKVIIAPDKVEKEIADGTALFTICASCHGEKAEKSALGKSQIIAGWDKQRTIDA